MTVSRSIVEANSNRAHAERPLVLLYNPRSVFHTMPLGLVAIGSALDRQRFDVRVIDGRFEADSLAALAPLIPRAVCLGVSVLTGRPIADALAVSRGVKALRPDLPIVWGGWHPSLFPVECLAEPSVDVTVQAQGEVTFAELVEHFAQGLGPEGVLGCAYRGRRSLPFQDSRSRVDEIGPIVENPTLDRPKSLADVDRPTLELPRFHVDDIGPILEPPRPLIDADVLPPHDYGLLNLERYFEAKGRRQLDYITSYGCYFRCTFCADPFVYGRKWTGLSPTRIVFELLSLCKDHAITDVNFQDETFFTYADRIDELAGRLIAAGRPFSWAGTLRADQASRMSEDLFARCEQSGLRRVLVGVESGSQAMLDWMKKDITLEQVFETAERCRRHGIAAQFPFIVGFPGESDESVRASLDVAKRLRAMSPTFETPFFYFKPYPGSEITERAVRDGYVLPESLEGWSEFEIHDRAGPWVNAETHALVERFKYYAALAWDEAPPWKRPLAAVARWRCRRDAYGLAWEWWVSRRRRRRPALS